ncbi:MAG: hypothetical protein H7A35_02575 [Planctomycetales bacterium]|nr:hypothetical protein [bacterium]UNM08944.1 MAG: hypothetical protein H7A35_02575 [Planctomycetales bacterium]
MRLSLLKMSPLSFLLLFAAIAECNAGDVTAAPVTGKEAGIVAQFVNADPNSRTPADLETRYYRYLTYPYFAYVHNDNLYILFDPGGASASPQRVSFSDLATGELIGEVSVTQDPEGYEGELECARDLIIMPVSKISDWIDGEIPWDAISMTVDCVLGKPQMLVPLID